MPSISRPTWQGVSTTREQSTIHHLTQELNRIEQSITTMRENLSTRNQNPSRGNCTSEIIDQIETWTNENPQNALKSLEISSKDLKQRIQTVVKSSAEIKNDMKLYFEESEAWGVAFMEESNKIDTELQALVTPTFETSSGNKLSVLTNTAKNWFNVIGTVGRNTITKLRRQLDDLGNVFSMPDNREGPYYDVMPYF